MKYIFLITFFVFAGFSISAQTGYNIGDVAEDFSLMNVDNKQVSMNQFDDAKGFIVIFTCNHCPYSKLYEDRIIALDNKYKNKGFPVIAINPNDPAIEPEDSFDKMKIRAKEKGFTFPYLLDEGQKVYPKYGATRTPHVFLLKKEEKNLIVKYIGAIDDNSKNVNEVKIKYLEDAVDALLEGKNSETNFTKAIGCSIKSK
jgi:peroxiredoxin